VTSAAHIAATPNRRHAAQVLQAAGGGDQDAGAGAGQQQTEHQRSGGFIAAVSIRVVGIRRFGALAVGHQHEGIGNDVRQRMHGVGNQALRVGDQAHHDLHHGQHNVHADADPGNALALGKTRAGAGVDLDVSQIGHVVVVGFAGHCGRVYSLPPFYNPACQRLSMGRLNEILSLAQARAREMKLAFEGALTVSCTISFDRFNSLADNEAQERIRAARARLGEGRCCSATTTSAPTSTSTPTSPATR
jgi:hypothetical protein